MAVDTLADVKWDYYRTQLGYSEVQAMGKSVSDLELEFFTNPSTVSQSQFTAHEADTTNVHGIVDTAKLVTLDTAQTITGLKTVSPSAASAVGLIVKAVSGQTADLQQWQDSAATVRSRIFYHGGASFDASVGAAALTVRNGVSTGEGTVAQFTGIQGLLMDMGGLGHTRIYNRNVGYGVPNEALLVESTVAGSRGVVIKGAASQTANLQEWQDSAGTMLGAVRPDGTLHFEGPGTSDGIRIEPGTGSPFATQIRWGDSGGSWTLRFLGQAGNVVADFKDLSSAAASFPSGAVFSGVSFSATSPNRILTYGDGTGWNLRIQGTSGLINALFSEIGTIGLLLTPTAASRIPLVTRGAASQTANLQEWQDSAGTVMSRILSSGIGLFQGDTAVTSAYVRCGALGQNVSALTVRGYFSNITGSSAGGIQVENLNVGSGVLGVGIVGGNLQAVVGGASAFVGSPSAATNVGVIVRGIASQTANLQEWQDSAAAVVAFVQPDGSARFQHNAALGTLATILIGARAQVGWDGPNNAIVLGGLSGATRTVNISGGADTLLQANPTIADGETALMLRRNVGSTFSLQRVSMGAADSGGTGFKLLRVAN